MKNSFSLITLFVVAALYILSSAASSYAQPEIIDPPPIAPRKTTPHRPNAQSGSIELEEDKVQLETYSSAQDGMITFLNDAQKLFKTVGEIGSVGAVTLQPPSERATYYYTTSFLYCAAKAGSCPFLLDAIFEYELLRSKVSGKAECQMLKRMWRFWVDGDMERRLQYMLPTAQITTYDKFKTTARKKYVQCEESIEKLLQDPAESDLKKRFSADSPALHSAANSIGFIALVKKKFTNIFQEVGINEKPTQDGKVPAKRR